MSLKNKGFNWGSTALIGLVAVLAGCGETPAEETAAIPILPTVAVAAKIEEQEIITESSSLDTFLEPTFTPQAQALIIPTSAGNFVFTPIPTDTPFPTLIPTATRTPNPTSTPVPTRTPFPTAFPTSTATPIGGNVTPEFIPTSAVTPVAAGENILFNPSFEDGHYNKDGIPELQLPNNWGFEYDTGRTGFGDESYDIWVRPEVRVLSKDFIPSSEHADFIADGDHTVKIFKGSGAISYRFSQAHQLEAGTYQFTVNIYPDVISGYESNGAKIFAPDPLSAEMSFLINGSQDAWRVVEIGKRSQFSKTFELSQAEAVQVAVAIRGRFAVENNGWFLDNFSLKKID